jgi:hypothetical protein
MPEDRLHMMDVRRLAPKVFMVVMHLLRTIATAGRSQIEWFFSGRCPVMIQAAKDVSATLHRSPDVLNPEGNRR